MNNCPRCGKLNDDDWMLESGPGGCQECWETECSESWWKMIEAIEDRRTIIPGKAPSRPSSLRAQCSRCLRSAGRYGVVDGWIVCWDCGWRPKDSESLIVLPERGDEQDTCH